MSETPGTLDVHSGPRDSDDSLSADEADEQLAADVDHKAQIRTRPIEAPE